MKTMKIRLLATMITLAAVTTAAITPANAQRRSSDRNTTANRPQKSNDERKRTVEKKSTFKDFEKSPRTSSNRKIETKREIKRSDAPTVTSRKSEPARISSNQNRTQNRNSGSVENSNRSNTKSGSVITDNNRQRSSGVQQKSRNNTSANTDNRERISARTNNSTSNSERYNSNSGRRESGTNGDRSVSRSTVIAKKYNLDNNDSRYSPTRDYRGSNKNWSNSYRPDNMNYNYSDRNYYRNYNYNKYSHWNRSWESYRWNHNSWYDYYHGYNPYSYKYHKYYYHHNYFGHVIRKFTFAPYIFIHNHNRYYCYNGHFFRYRKGVGYVLVDMPFGFTFDYLPTGYERVYINGYMYLRVGNLFFEASNLGFRLVHYPERYFAYDDGYVNDGYPFDDY